MLVDIQYRKAIKNKVWSSAFKLVSRIKLYIGTPKNIWRPSLFLIYESIRICKRRSRFLQYYPYGSGPPINLFNYYSPPFFLSLMPSLSCPSDCKILRLCSSPYFGVIFCQEIYIPLQYAILSNIIMAFQFCHGAGQSSCNQNCIKYYTKSFILSTS